MLSLPLHLSIHFFFGFLAGMIVWLYFRKNLLLALLGGFLGGFMVDFDHFIDYFLAFGWNFNFYWFSKGYEFLKNDRTYLFFHAWEYIVIFAFLAIILKKHFLKTRIFLFSLALGLFFHLSGDVIMNEGLMIKSYSLIYKIRSDFQIKKMVTPKHYEKNLKKIQEPKIKQIIENN